MAARRISKIRTSSIRWRGSTKSSDTEIGLKSISCYSKCGVVYERADRALMAVRGRLHRVLMELFCDFSSTKSFLYSTSGRALIDKYRCNPYRIVRAGRTRFERAMRRRAPRIRQRSLDRLWEDATSSARHQRTREYTDRLELKLGQLWEEFLLYEQRKAILEKRLISLLRRVRQKDPGVPTPTPGVISAKNLARLLAETGALSDFASWRMLLRKILGQVIFPLVCRSGLYGDYYRRKRLAMPGQKAMTAVMRHFLRKLHGWYRSGQAFDAQRHFTAAAPSERQAA